MFYVELPEVPGAVKDGHRRATPRGTTAARARRRRHRPARAPNGKPRVEVYFSPPELQNGKRLKTFERLKTDARSLRASAENTDFEVRVLQLERRCFIAADVLVAAAALVEDDVTQAEQGEAKALIRSLLEQV
jgi:hypothetical protein